MILLESGNRALRALLTRLFSASGADSGVMIICADYDGIRYQIECGKKERVLHIDVAIPRFDVFTRRAESRAYMDQIYGPLRAPQSAPGYDMRLDINLDAAEGERAAIVEKVSKFRENLIGSILTPHFDAMLEKKAIDRTVLEIGGGDIMVVGNTRDNGLFVSFCLRIADNDDAALAMVLLKAYAEGGHQSGAPPAKFSPDRPPEMEGVDVPRDRNTGFLTFSLFATQATKEARGKAITLFSNFRAYVRFHLKSTKSYLHSRMRRRVDSWVQVMNRAKPELAARKPAGGPKSVPVLQRK